MTAGRTDHGDRAGREEHDLEDQEPGQPVRGVHQAQAAKEAEELVAALVCNEVKGDGGHEEEAEHDHPGHHAAQVFYVGALLPVAGRGGVARTVLEQLCLLLPELAVVQVISLVVVLEGGQIGGLQSLLQGQKGEVDAVRVASRVVVVLRVIVEYHVGHVRRIDSIQGRTQFSCGPQGLVAEENGVLHHTQIGRHILLSSQIRAKPQHVLSHNQIIRRA